MNYCVLPAGQKVVKKLLEQLVNIQAGLFKQNPETKYMTSGNPQLAGKKRSDFKLFHNNFSIIDISLG